MPDKQLYAKVGVFVLLGLNAGAYYVFWPHRDAGSKSEARSPTEEKGEALLLPPAYQQPNTAKPKEFHVNPRRDAVPLNIPGPARSSEKEMSADEAVSKLLDHIKRERTAEDKTPAAPFDEKKYVLPEKQDPPAKERDLPAVPMFPVEDKPKPLPPLKADPLLPEASNPNIGVTSPLTPRTAPGLWLLHSEPVGEQTLLVARLQQAGSARALAEFRILCDRVDSKGAGGDVQAVGRVTFTGAGLKGACQRLTLAAHESQLVFEGQVYIARETAGGGNLRGDRAIWEFPTPTLDPTAAVLGAPK